MTGLAPERASLARDTLAWGDRFWDDGPALVSAPPGAGAGDVHLVPQSCWYAYGLLMRDDADDAPRALRCIESLLALQYQDPGEPWHGTFARFAETPRPGEGAVMWVDFDPNWRQFLGTTFLALLQDFESRLSGKLVEGIERALRLAVEGEPEDRAPASYTNIALMKAFLAVEAGERLGEAGWVRKGEALAREIAAGYRRFGAFEEYNSPTYYGIDFYALSLWSVRSSSETLRSIGAELEAALWRDVARWYHAGLRNLCGPYSRTYGIDLQDYAALLALQVWAAAGRDAAPLPPLEPEAHHGHDLFLGPLTAALGARVPDDVLPHLERFQGERCVEQQVAEHPARIATGWLGEHMMIGAERSESDRYSRWGQFVPATVHWRLPSGGSGWLLMRSSAAPQASAAPGVLDFGWPAARVERPLQVVVRAPGAEPGDFQKRHWQLPGLEVQVETELGAPEVSIDGPYLRLAYSRTRARADHLRLVFSPG